MKRIKIFTALLLAAMMSLGAVVPVAANQPITVVLNGMPLGFDVPPQIIDGRTMVPMRGIFEAMGADITWIGEQQRIIAVSGDTILEMTIGVAVMTRNGAPITLDVPPQIVNDRTLVPIRAVAEGMDAEVDWVDATRTVVITRAQAAPVEPPPVYVPEEPPVAEPEPEPEEEAPEEEPAEEYEEEYEPEEEAEEEPVEDTRPARNRNQRAAMGYPNRAIAETRYLARLAFEQTDLALFVHRMEEEMIDAIHEYLDFNELEHIENIVRDIFSLSAATLIAEDRRDVGDHAPFVVALDDLNRDAISFADMQEVFADMFELYNLGQDHIARVSTARMASNVTAVILEMRPTDIQLLSSFVGIAYHADYGLRVYTLQLDDDFSGDGDHTFASLRRAAGNEVTRSVIGRVDNRRRAFVDAVEDAARPAPAVEPTPTPEILHVALMPETTVYHTDNLEFRVVTNLEVVQVTLLNATTGATLVTAATRPAAQDSELEWAFNWNVGNAGLAFASGEDAAFESVVFPFTIRAHAAPHATHGNVFAERSVDITITN